MPTDMWLLAIVAACHWMMLELAAFTAGLALGSGIRGLAGAGRAGGWGAILPGIDREAVLRAAGGGDRVALLARKSATPARCRWRMRGQ